MYDVFGARIAYLFAAVIYTLGYLLMFSVKLFFFSFVLLDTKKETWISERTYFNLKLQQQGYNRQVNASAGAMSFYYFLAGTGACAS